MTAALNQLWQDMAPDMVDRDRRLRITEISDTHALCVVEHDLVGLTGRTARIRLDRLKPPAYRLVEDAGDGDALYAAILAAIAKVHRPDATPADYARAARDAV
ncbi:DUF6354 family protein [Streptomyces sparsogenes]|uniref:DUF6354 family protein n=1 Tax=Streptomyces sparsogenes TaxID=67365 RepID=UPI00340A23D2